MWQGYIPYISVLVFIIVLNFSLARTTSCIYTRYDFCWDCLCGLVVRVSGYRYRGHGFDSRRYQIFWVVVGLEPPEVNWGATWLKCSGSRSRKQRLTAVGIRCADHETPLYPQKLVLTSPTGGGRSVAIVRSRTKATEFSLVFYI
jgi:hypothetical protein